MSNDLFDYFGGTAERPDEPSDEELDLSDLENLDEDALESTASDTSGVDEPRLASEDIKLERPDAFELDELDDEFIDEADDDATPLDDDLDELDVERSASPR